MALRRGTLPARMKARQRWLDFLGFAAVGPLADLSASARSTESPEAQGLTLIQSSRPLAPVRRFVCRCSRSLREDWTYKDPASSSDLAFYSHKTEKTSIYQRNHSAKAASLHNASFESSSINNNNLHPIHIHNGRSFGNPASLHCSGHL